MRVVTAWLKRGGRALDAAYVYGDQVGVGKAIKASGVPRSEIFLTGKVPSGGGGPGPKAGGGVTMGYDETIDSGGFYSRWFSAPLGEGEDCYWRRR